MIATMWYIQWYGISIFKDREDQDTDNHVAVSDEAHVEDEAKCEAIAACGKGDGTEAETTGMCELVIVSDPYLAYFFNAETT